MLWVSKSARLTIVTVLTFWAGVCSAENSLPRTGGHHIQLGPFFDPAAGTVGLLVKARINGGPVLRLLLDSGARYMVLDRRVAMKFGCSGGSSEVDLVGAGAAAASVVQIQRAGTVEIGSLILHDVPLLIAAQPLADGVQGVVPFSLFAEFLIRLDIPAKTLDLLPYPAGQLDPDGALPTVSNNHLLFIKGIVNDTCVGYFLLDTGASYTAISENLIHQLQIPASFVGRVPLRGGTAEMNAPLLHNSIRLRLGSQELPVPSVVAVDLSTPSRYHNLEISGLIGYPALRDSVLLVSYRDNLLRIEPRKTAAQP